MKYPQDYINLIGSVSSGKLNFASLDFLAPVID